jgi:hypothetical protein
LLACPANKRESKSLKPLQAKEKTLRTIGVKIRKREELMTAAQKAILENAHNPDAPAVVQIWQNQKLGKFPIAYRYLGHRLNQSTGRMQHVYNLDAREVLKECQ